MTGVWKFSGDAVKLGGQAWFKVNKYVWIGGETVSSLTGDGDGEVFTSLDFDIWTLNVLPYIGFYIKSEHFGGAGIKVYSKDKQIAFGIEYKSYGFAHAVKGDYDLVFSISAAVHKEIFSKIQEMFGVAIPDEV